MPSGKWDEIRKFRKDLAAATLTDEDAAAGRKKIDELLTELSAAGDMDAVAQKTIQDLSALLDQGVITQCEAIARFLDAIALAVKALPASPRAAELFPPVPPLPGGTTGAGPSGSLAMSAPSYDDWVLSYAWTYLVDPVDQHELRPLFEGRLRPRGFEAPAWTSTHGEEIGGPGSGWFAPLPEDADNLKNARSGKTAHFLAGAIIARKLGTAGDVVRWGIDRVEDSPTDIAVERLGSAFGHGLGRSIPLDGVGEWFRSQACTEGKPGDPAHFSPAEADGMRWGVWKGFVHKIVIGKARDLAFGGHGHMWWTYRDEANSQVTVRAGLRYQDVGRLQSDFGKPFGTTALSAVKNIRYADGFKERKEKTWEEPVEGVDGRVDLDPANTDGHRYSITGFSSMDLTGYVSDDKTIRGRVTNESGSASGDFWSQTRITWIFYFTPLRPAHLDACPSMPHHQLGDALASFDNLVTAEVQKIAAALIAAGKYQSAAAYQDMLEPARAYVSSDWYPAASKLDSAIIAAQTDAYGRWLDQDPAYDDALATVRALCERQQQLNRAPQTKYVEAAERIASGAREIDPVAAEAVAALAGRLREGGALSFSSGNL